MVEEQQERLRRFVDEWRGHLNGKLDVLQGEALEFSFNGIGHMNSEPLHISMEPKESVTITRLVETNNASFNKILMVLAYDCFEIGHLGRQALKQYFPQLLTFGLSSGPEEVLLEGEPQKKFARSFKFFYELSDFLYRLRAILSNLVQQLEAIYSGDVRNKSHNSFAHVHLQKVIICIADGFGILLTLDEIMGKNSAIGHAFSLFIRMLHVVRSDLSKFETKVEHVESLDKIVKEIGDALQPGIFLRCLRDDFHRGTQELKLSRQCLGEISLCVHDGLLQLLSAIDTLKEKPNDRMLLAGLLAVFILYSWSNVGGPEKKVEKLIVEVLRRVPVLHVYSCVRLIPLDLLMSHLPPLALSWPFLKEMEKEAGTNKINFLATIDDAFARDIQGLQSAITKWATVFGSAVSPLVQQSALHIRRHQLLEGIYAANRLRHLLTASIDLHATLEMPVRKERLMNMCHAAAFVKVVENTFHRTSCDIAQSIAHIIHLIQIQIQKRLFALKVQLEDELQGQSKMKGFSLLSFYLTHSGRDLRSKISDGLAAVDLALKMLEDTASEKRRAVLCIALNFIESMRCNNNRDNWRRISSLVSELNLVAELNSFVEAATDCTFLYWRRELYSTCFASVYVQSEMILGLQFVVNVLLDGVKLLKRGNAEESLVVAYEHEIEKNLTDEIIKPLSKDIETDLRLHVHSAHMKGAITTNPTKTGIRDVSWFLHVKPIKLASKFIFIKSRVETYLNSTFYDHVAMSRNSWKTYCEMRHLAEQKYGLDLDDIHLPGQILEQGVDVLKIIRNIHSFVSCYNYDLNAEAFIEKISVHDCKQLNTIGVNHVTNSIRTHGPGIISTTVNFIYQLLAQKFVMFSQFLFDDHIKSLLLKETHFWKEHKDHKMGYPVIRAEKMNKNIRKLGLSNYDIPFLDQFRHLISEIGNALGFVRMLRTGEMRYFSTASGFVLNTKMDQSFEEAIKRSNLSLGSVMAGKILDTSLKNLDMCSEQKNYFSILTTIFAKELQNSDNIHLREFYLMLPAMTINAVESILQFKDKPFKRGRAATNFFLNDDGLILGIVYVIKVLDQDKQFDSLRWFDSAKQHYRMEKARIENEMNMDIESGMTGLQVWSQKLASMSEEEAQNLRLMAKKLSSYVTELEIMEYKLHASRVFFL